MFLCVPPAPLPAEPPFVETGAQALPGVTTRCGSPSKNWILEVDGGGLALEDFDGDGHVDLLVVDGSTLERVRADEPGFPPRLFLGRGDGTFAPAGETWSMAGGRWGMGVAAGDVDGDGWTDVVITEWGRDRLLLNDAGEGWRDATESAGFKGRRWGTSAALFDYDGDGHLDLAIVNYLAFDPDEVPGPGGGCRWKGHDVMCGPEGLVPVHDQLYRGLGDGRFEDVTFETGLRPERAGYGLGIMTLDYDVDGDTDLYVTNDSTPNLLWENQGDGTFVERAFERGVSRDANGKEQAGMGIACADVNGDGRSDLFITNFSGENNALYLSARRGGFRERSSVSGVGGASVSSLGWGTGFLDVDLDGDLDLYVLNGHVYPQADRPGTDTSYAQADQLFRNEGGHFVPEPLSDAAPSVSRAAAAADLDEDGDLDLVALDLDGALRVLINRTRPASGSSDGGPHWLRVRLVGRGANRAALGARVTVVGEGLEQMAEIRSAGGFQASIPAEASFGLGAVAELERVVVRWPSGDEQVLEGVAVDRVLLIEQEGP